MKSKQRGDAEVMASLILGAIGLVLWMVFSAWSCGSRWGKSDMRTSWGPVQGCLVQTPSGRWVPDDRVRDVDLEPRQTQAPKTDIPR